MKKLTVLLLVFSLLLAITAGNAWSVVALPNALLTGPVSTTAGIGTGTLTFDNVWIPMLMYKDGYSCTNFCGADESILGAMVTLTGAVRTGDYSYTDATIAISDPTDPSFKFFTATLSNINFITDGGPQWYMNPLIDDNLSNFVLNTDANHPSRFINEFQESLETNNVSGMKLILLPFSGDFSSNSRGSISSGLIAGPPPGTPVPEPSSLILLISGGAALWFRAYRKKKGIK